MFPILYDVTKCYSLVVTIDVLLFVCSLILWCGWAFLTLSVGDSPFYLLLVVDCSYHHLPVPPTHHDNFTCLQLQLPLQGLCYCYYFILQKQKQLCSSWAWYCGGVCVGTMPLYHLNLLVLQWYSHLWYLQWYRWSRTCF